jgi:hypothetical protein
MTNEKLPQSEKEPAPPCPLEFQRMLEDYIAELRAIIDKLHRKLN